MTSGSVMETLPNGIMVWRNAEKLIHRLDGPAIIKPGCYEEWRINGQRHREDGPAVERVNGSKKWYIRGNLHRLDGPAVIEDSSEEHWAYGRMLNWFLLKRFHTMIPQKHLAYFLLAFPSIELDTTKAEVYSLTGWNPDTTPTEHQTSTWHMMVALQPPPFLL